MLEKKINSFGKRRWIAAAALSLVTNVGMLSGCGIESVEKCSLSSSSENNLCYSQNADGAAYFCTDGQECKCTKPEGAFDDECFCECYTPSCCGQISCDLGEHCVPEELGMCKCQPVHEGKMYLEFVSKNVEGK